MTTPIRITYREDVEHFIEAQSQSPPSLGRQIPRGIQNKIMALAVVLALVIAFGTELRGGTSVNIALLAIVSTVAVMAFWFWLFRKLGWDKQTNYQDYRWTEKDRERFERRYAKKVGDEKMSVVCELDESGVRFNPDSAGSRTYRWDEISKAIERPKGLFVYVKSWMYLWLPRAAFASQEEFQSALELVGAHTKLERLNLSKMAYVALGSNLGDRVETFQQVLLELRDISDYPLLKSSFWETTPVDCPPGSPGFLNAVVAMTPKPGETPESLLQKLQALEKKFGRKPKKMMNEARPLDLDLIAFGNEIRSTPELTLPHPRAHLRQFVLQPLAEIAPDLVLPGQGTSVSHLLNQLTSAEIVRKLT